MPPPRLLTSWLVALALGSALACSHRATVESRSRQTPASPSPAPRAPEVTPQSPAAEPQATRDVLARARAILAQVKDRPLSAEQRDQVDSGAAFIDQAEAALGDGDPNRAAVLADKALALLQQVDEATRPA